MSETDSVMTEVQRQKFKHGEKRRNLMNVLSSYIHVEKLETVSHIGVEMHLERDMSKQTGTVVDLLKGSDSHWEVRDIHIQDGEMWTVEVIYVE